MTCIFCANRRWTFIIVGVAGLALATANYMFAANLPVDKGTSFGLSGRLPMGPIKSSNDISGSVDQTGTSIEPEPGMTHFVSPFSPLETDFWINKGVHQLGQLFFSNLARFAVTDASELIDAPSDEPMTLAVPGGSTNIVRTFTNSDPFIAFDLVATNPNAAAMVIDFEQFGDTEVLPLSITAEAFTELAVFDTGGLAGANASLTQNYSIRTSDEANNALNGGFGGLSATDALADSAVVGPLDQDLAGDPNLIDVDGMTTSFSITISPGDTVHVRGYFSMQDQSLALPDGDLILDGLQNVVNITPVPEPSAIFLVAWALCTATLFRRPRS